MFFYFHFVLNNVAGRSGLGSLTKSASDPQENIIREFNLNELFQKSKKLNKRSGLNEEAQNGSQPEEGGEELRLGNTDSEQPKESKKDQ